jgi:hypothetical protein
MKRKKKTKPPRDREHHPAVQISRRRRRSDLGTGRERRRGGGGGGGKDGTTNQPVGERARLRCSFLATNYLFPLFRRRLGSIRGIDEVVGVRL